MFEEILEKLKNEFNFSTLTNSNDRLISTDFIYDNNVSLDDFKRLFSEKHCKLRFAAIDDNRLQWALSEVKPGEIVTTVSVETSFLEYLYDDYLPKIYNERNNPKN